MTCLWFLSLLAYGLTILEGVNCWIYIYSNKNKTYDDAEKWCRNHNAKLVAIQNKSINGYLNETLPHNPGYYWIGLKKINNKWTWVATNEKLMKKDENWATGEPNDLKKDEDCVEIYIKRREDAGKWNDEKCDKAKLALCYRASCNESTCSGNGQCNEGFNNYTCECNPGFYGRNCELAVTCPALTPIANGSANCSDPSANVTWGTNCTFTCEEGFILKGPDTLHCGSSGNWSEEQPSCEAVTCPAPSIAHGSVNCSDPSANVTWGTNCTFTCEEGFILNGPVTLHCESSGNWTEEQPSCEAVTCPAPSIAHGSVTCSDPSVNVTWGNNCTFTCEEGFVLKGPDTLHCGSSGNWTEEQPSCKAVTCPALTPIAHGSVTCSDPSANVTWGNSCKFTCEEGFILNGPDTLQCGSSGNWSEEQPSCKAVTCPALTPIANGSMTCSHPSANVTWGTNCTFTCEEGFVLKGPDTLHCESSGKWTKEQPSCEAVTCPALTPIAHGSVTCSDPSANVTWGNNCTFTCEEGFVLKGPDTLHCGSSGNWTKEQPSCEVVTCPAPSIAHGSVNCSDPSVNVTWGTNCTFSCEEGFVLKGPDTLHCGSSGNWTEEQPSCEAVTCPALTPIANGSVTCSDPSVNVTWGTNCTFTCEEGFILKGPVTLHCESSGNWTEEQPSCEVVTCPALTPIANGSVTCSHPSANVTWGNSCTFTCEEGFILNGPDTLHCGSSGNWSEEQPSCEAVTCPAPSIAHGSVNCSDPSANVTWGTSCTFTCEEGFVLKGPDTLHCGSSGNWTEEQPSCEAVTCPAPSIAHSSVNCSDPSANVTWGNNCTFTCEEGFILKGPDTLHCESSGNWTEEQPSCEAVTCPALTPIAHGSVTCSDPSVNVTWGNNCTFTCEEGFVLNGPDTLHCESSGNWTEEQPSCEAVTCPAPSIAHGSVNCSDPSVNVPWGNNCTFTCEEGFVLKGPDTLQCGSSGNWTKEQPSCKASGRSNQVNQVNYVYAGIAAVSASVMTTAALFLWLARRLRKKAKKFTPSSSCQSLTTEGSFQHVGKTV